MKISVVIPAYNEDKLVGRVVSQARNFSDNVIVVDDGSIDQTSSRARQAGAQVIKHPINRGQGAALQTGINCALENGADIIVTFDADGQHLAEEIDSVVKPLLLGEVDAVLGSRFMDRDLKMPWVRRAVLKLATLFTRLHTGLKITDTHNGFRAFSRSAAQTIKIQQDGMAHASEIIEQIKKNALRFKEVPVTIRYTDYSLQKGQKLSNSFRILWDLIIAKISK